MAVTFSASTAVDSSGDGNVSPGSLIVPFDHIAGEALVVVVHWVETGASAGGIYVSEITFTGLNLTQLGTVLKNGVNTEIWWLKAASGGLNDVEVVWDGDVSVFEASIQVFALAGKPTTVGDIQTASGTSTSPSVTITAVASTGLIVNALGVAATGLDITLTATETEIVEGSTFGSQSGSSYVTGYTPGSVATGWTLSSSKPWGQIAVEFIDSVLQDVIMSCGVVVFPR